MRKQIISEEIRRMQKLAGILKEDVEVVNKIKQTEPENLPKLLDTLTVAERREAYFELDEEGTANHEEKLKIINGFFNPELQTDGDKVASEINKDYKCIIQKNTENNVVYLFFTSTGNKKNAEIRIRIDKSGHKTEEGDEPSNIEGFDAFIEKVKDLEIVKLN